MSKYRPYDLIHWTAFLDVNALRDDEVDIVARYNIDDDVQLAALTEKWLRPKFLQMNEVDRKVLRQILECADDWPPKEVEKVLSHFRMPTQQTVQDVPRFIAALKQASRAQ